MRTAALDFQSQALPHTVRGHWEKSGQALESRLSAGWAGHLEQSPGDGHRNGGSPWPMDFSPTWKGCLQTRAKQVFLHGLSGGLLRSQQVMAEGIVGCVIMCLREDAGCQRSDQRSKEDTWTLQRQPAEPRLWERVRSGLWGWTEPHTHYIATTSRKTHNSPITTEIALCQPLTIIPPSTISNLWLPPVCSPSL